MTDIKKMTAAEFRELGYLQELNRRWLHPLGLALEVVTDEDGQVTGFGQVWDYRDDPEGMVFAQPLDEKAAARIERERMNLAKTRWERLGFVTQPISGDVPPGDPDDD